MQGKMESVHFLNFDIYDNTHSKVALNCYVQFSIQIPEDQAILQRGLLVSFDAEADNKSMYIHIKCRVAYGFPDKEQIPSEEEFIQQYCQDAYAVFQKETNKVIRTMGKNELQFLAVE